jgi:hypothetical protein
MFYYHSMSSSSEETELTDTISLMAGIGTSTLVFVVYILLLSSSYIGDYPNERLVYALVEQNNTNNNQSSSINIK